MTDARLIGDDPPPSGAELAEWDAAVKACREGDPRRFIESFLWIKDVDKRLVRFKLTKLQEDAYRETFGKLKDFTTPMTVVYVKPRDAKSTTLWMACAFAFRVCVPGFDAGMGIDVEAKISVALVPIDDGFYDNLPWWGKPVKGHWDNGFREFVYSKDGQTLKSSMEFFSARSQSTGRSKRWKMRILSEHAYNDPTLERGYMQGMIGSKTENAWDIKESTPFRPSGDFYQSYRSIIDGTSPGVAIFRTWLDKPEARLHPKHPSVRPVDRREIEETGGLTYTEDERTVLEMLRNDGVPSLERILSRRRKIGEYTQAEDGDPKRGRAAFLRDEPENDISCWLTSGNPQFDQDIIDALIRQAKPPILDTESEGLRTRIWRHPVPGEQYIVPADFSTGQSKDSTAIYALCVGSGEYVAEIHGKAFMRIGVAQGAKLARVYNNALWTPETNYIGAETADIAVKDLEYRDYTYRRPARPGENMDTEHYRNRRWGWDTSGGVGGSRARMLSALRAGFNSGRLWTRNEALVRDLQAFDPDIDEHLRDRQAGAAIGAAVLEERYGRVEGRAIVKARGQKRPFFPPRPAAPFQVGA